jgi:hypothetical protein
VKCRPVRSDGHKGEIFTSMPSLLIAVHRPESNLDLDTKKVNASQDKTSIGESKLEIPAGDLDSKINDT